MKKLITGALALILLTTASQAQETKKTDRKDHKVAAAERLGLSSEQQAKMKEINEAQRAEMKALKEANLSKEQQAQRRKEIHQKYSAQRQALLTAEQREKAKAMREKAAKTGKFEGKKGKGDRERGMARGADLNLTDAQKEKMKALRTQFSADRDKIRNNASLTEAQKKEQYRALAQQHQEQLKSILTPEQIQKMEGARKGKKGKAVTR